MSESSKCNPIDEICEGVHDAHSSGSNFFQCAFETGTDTDNIVQVMHTIKVLQLIGVKLIMQMSIHEFEIDSEYLSNDSFIQPPEYYKNVLSITIDVNQALPILIEKGFIK